MDILNINLLNITLNLVNYLRKNDFLIPSNKIICFFEIIKDINILSKDSIKNITKSIFCTNEVEYKKYDDLFNNFFESYKTTSFESLLKLQEKKNINELNKKISNLESEFNDKFKKIIKEYDELIQEVINDNIDVFKKQQSILNVLSLDEINYLEHLLNEIDDENLKSLINLKKDNLLNITKDNISSSLNKLMLLNINNKNISSINNLILESSNVTNILDNSLNSMKKKYDNINKTFNENKKNIDIQYNKNIYKIKEKIETIKHRETFLEGYNSIHCLSNINDKTICSLDKNEYISLLDYIKLNANKFKSKLSINMKSSKNKIFDNKKTFQESIKFNGNPLKYYYKKPIIKKYKLVCCLDISGSVSKHLDSIISFIYELNTVFNGGIEIYGFVNKLINYTFIFKNYTTKELIYEIKGSRGYSNYTIPIKQLNNTSIDKNTIILFFGDSRNNKNESFCNDLNELYNKSKKIIWLNPENKSKWNKADSTMSLISNIIGNNNIYEIEKVSQLINFLNDFSI